jgi:hypothetical protein
VAGLEIDQAVKRLSAESSARYPAYKRKQSLRWATEYAVWYDGVAFVYKIFRVADDGFVMIMRHLDDEGGGRDYFGRR